MLSTTSRRVRVDDILLEWLSFLSSFDFSCFPGRYRLDSKSDMLQDSGWQLAYCLKSCEARGMHFQTPRRELALVPQWDGHSMLESPFRSLRKAR